MSRKTQLEIVREAVKGRIVKDLRSVQIGKTPFLHIVFDDDTAMEIWGTLSFPDHGGRRTQRGLVIEVLSPMQVTNRLTEIEA